MITPMELLENSNVNMYELTVATIRRAFQLTMTGDAELEQNNGKVVPTAISQILTEKVAYRLEE